MLTYFVFYPFQKTLQGPSPEFVGITDSLEEAFEDWTEAREDKFVGLNGDVSTAQKYDIFGCFRTR